MTNEKRGMVAGGVDVYHLRAWLTSQEWDVYRKRTWLIAQDW